MEGYNEDPVGSRPVSLLVDLYYQGSELVMNYGWWLLAAGLVLAYYWPTIQTKLDEWYAHRSEREYDAKYKKDTELFRKRQEEMDAARQRMQEKLNADAARAKEREERKRLEQQTVREAAMGNRLGNVTSAEDKKNSFKPEYNPLMGNSSGGGYRPPRRSCCPSGGCG